MPRVSLREIQSLKDIHQNGNYNFVIADIPGGEGDVRNLRLYCSRVEAPGKGHEGFQVDLFGHKFSFRGKNASDKRFTASYYENENLDTDKAIRGWLDKVLSEEEGNSGGRKEDYSTSGDLEIFDTTGKVIRTYTFFNLFPESMEKIEYGSDGSSPVQVTVSFMYDYYTYT